MIIDNKISESLIALYQYIGKGIPSGYDPYDIKAHPGVIRLIALSQHSRFYTVLRELIFEFFFVFPLLSRKLLRIKPGINAKALGLLADAYLDLYTVTGEEGYLNTANLYLDWLIEHPAKTEKSLAWGYPFDWQSTEFIPRNTPNGIVTTAVGAAFWKIYKLTEDKKYLDILTRIGEFLASLPIDYINDHQLCFAYTPLFQNHVHNLNLFVAEYLLKVGLETDNKRWVNLANAAINYTLHDQHSDGSFDYNGPPEKSANFIDHYHTGFVLRMLYSTWKLTGREDVFTALKKGYRFYDENLFDRSIPKLKPNQKYRIDIHSCAEAVICLCTLEEIFPEAKNRAGEVLNWTIRHLQDKKGYFYYGILRSRLLGFTWKSKIPYFRWGQAWMMKAFATYMKNTTDNSNDA